MKKPLPEVHTKSALPLAHCGGGLLKRAGGCARRGSGKSVRRHCQPVSPIAAFLAASDRALAAPSGLSSRPVTASAVPPPDGHIVSTRLVRSRHQSTLVQVRLCCSPPLVALAHVKQVQVQLTCFSSKSVCLCLTVNGGANRACHPHLVPMILSFVSVEPNLIFTLCFFSMSSHALRKSQ